MTSSADVLRDLRRGDAVHVRWAPDAVAELEIAGVVRVARGWVRLVREEDVAIAERARVEQASRARAGRRGSRRLSAERRVLVEERLRIGPATTRDLAEVAGMRLDRVRLLARRIGARLQYAEDARGRPVPYWRLG